MESINIKDTFEHNGEKYGISLINTGEKQGDEYGIATSHISQGLAVWVYAPEDTGSELAWKLVHNFGESVPEDESLEKAIEWVEENL